MLRTFVMGVSVLVLAGIGCDVQVAPPSALPAPQPTGGFDAGDVTEIISGGGIGFEGFQASGGNRHRDGKGLDIFYGFMTPPGGEPKLLYVGLFKVPAKYSSSGPPAGGTQTAGSGSEISIIDGQTFDGKEIKIQLALTIDAAAGTVTREELQVNGEPAYVSKGRLLLLDFSGDKATWKQADVDLAPAFAGIDIKDAAAMGTKGIDQLRASAPAVDEFVK